MSSEIVDEAVGDGGDVVLAQEATRERCLFLKRALLHLVVSGEMNAFAHDPSFVTEHPESVLGMSRRKVCEQGERECVCVVLCLLCACNAG